MRLQPADAPLDAFFTHVRRRHAEVDIVLLPAAERAWEVLSPRATAAPPTGWRYGPDDGTVLASARTSTTAPDGFAALVELRADLEAGGWRVRRLPGAVERLSGMRGGLRIQASYAEHTGALMLDVSSKPLLVGRGRARALVRR